MFLQDYLTQCAKILLQPTLNYYNCQTQSVKGISTFIIIVTFKNE